MEENPGELGLTNMFGPLFKTLRELGVNPDDLYGDSGEWRE